MSYELKATERDTTLNPRQLRSAGFVPATLYGGEKGSVSVQVRSHEFVQSFAAGNRDYKLAGVEGDVAVRVQQYQMDPVSRKVLNIEFKRQVATSGKKAAGKSAKASQPVQENRVEEQEAALTGA